MGSEGGKARALKLKKEVEERINAYHQNPNRCLYCNKPILVEGKRKLTDAKNQKFCCRSCATAYNNKKRIFLNPRNTSKMIKSRKLDYFTDSEIEFLYNNCDTLTEFMNNLGYANSISYKNLPQSFLIRCNEIGIDLSKYLVQRENILEMTKGELITKRGYPNARAAICHHARTIYNQSNKLKHCIVCGYKNHYEVAHIISVSDFPDDVFVSDINNLDNLVALCPNHHWEYDKNILNLKPYLNVN